MNAAFVAFVVAVSLLAFAAMAAPAAAQSVDIQPVDDVSEDTQSIVVDVDVDEVGAATAVQFDTTGFDVELTDETVDQNAFAVSIDDDTQTIEFGEPGASTTYSIGVEFVGADAGDSAVIDAGVDPNAGYDHPHEGADATDSESFGVLGDGDHGDDGVAEAEHGDDGVEDDEESEDDERAEGGEEADEDDEAEDDDVDDVNEEGLPGGFTAGVTVAALVALFATRTMRSFTEV